MNTSISTVKRIRERIVQLLRESEIQLVGDKVYDARTENAWPTEGVFVIVSSGRSDFDDRGTSPVNYKVETEINIDVVFAGSEEIDVTDALDFVSSELLKNLMGYPHPTWLIEDEVSWDSLVLTNVEPTLNGDGEVDKGAQRITFAVTWYWEPPQKYAAPEYRFKEAHTEIVLGENFKSGKILDSQDRVITDDRLRELEYLQIKRTGVDLQFDTNINERR